MAPPAGLPPDAGPVLLALARRAIADGLAPRPPIMPTAPGTPGDGAGRPGEPELPEWLTAPGACFVTLTQNGTLRGCIGSVSAWRPLADDVRANAVAAAVHDHRFPPLQVEELPATRLEVSVPSPPEPLDCPDEDAALVALRPGVDGVVFACGGRRATFLPQVWERLADPRAFLASLRRKAGLPEDYWAEDVQLSRYTVTAWEDPVPDHAPVPSEAAASENATDTTNEQRSNRTIPEASP